MQEVRVYNRFDFINSIVPKLANLRCVLGDRCGGQCSPNKIDPQEYTILNLPETGGGIIAKIARRTFITYPRRLCTVKTKFFNDSSSSIIRIVFEVNGEENLNYVTSIAEIIYAKEMPGTILEVTVCPFSG